MDLREHVVNDMVLDYTVEDVAADEAEFSVHGGSSTLDESPFLGFVVGSLWVSVVKVSDGNCNVSILEYFEINTQSSYRSSGSSTSKAVRMPAKQSSLLRSLKPNTTQT